MSDSIASLDTRPGLFEALAKKWPEIEWAAANRMGDPLCVFCDLEMPMGNSGSPGDHARLCLWVAMRDFLATQHR